MHTQKNSQAREQFASYGLRCCNARDTRSVFTGPSSRPALLAALSQASLQRKKSECDVNVSSNQIAV